MIRGYLMACSNLYYTISNQGIMSICKGNHADRKLEKQGLQKESGKFIRTQKKYMEHSK